MAAAAQQAGAEIRTGAEVIEIRIKNGAAHSVILSTGEEIHGRAMISNADPKRTFLRLIDPVLLAPWFTRRMQNYRMNGTVAKVNLALSDLPTFTALNRKSRGAYADVSRSARRSTTSNAHSMSPNTGISLTRRISKLQFHL